jgi:hypothetical protein
LHTGQEIYYATHQFFLSERSLFLIVFNVLDLVQSRVEYWYEPQREREREARH